MGTWCASSRPTQDLRGVKPKLQQCVSLSRFLSERVEMKDKGKAALAVTQVPFQLWKGDMPCLTLYFH